MTPPPLPSQQPPPYAMIVSTPADPRPVSLRVLSILGIVFGGSTLLSPIVTLATYAGQRFAPPAGAGATTPAFAAPTTQMFNGDVLPWTIASSVLAGALGAMLLAASIGAWRLRPWARRTMLVYAVLAIAFAAACGAVNATIVMPKMFESIAHPSGPWSPGAVSVFAAVIGVTGAVIGSIFPTCLLIFFRRPNVVAAFARDVPRAAGGDVA